MGPRSLIAQSLLQKYKLTKNPWGSSSWLGKTCWRSRHYSGLDITDDAALCICTCPMHLLRTTGSILEKAPWRWLYSDQTRWINTAICSCGRPEQLIPPSLHACDQITEKAAFTSGDPGTRIVRSLQPGGWTHWSLIALQHWCTSIPTVCELPDAI